MPDDEGVDIGNPAGFAAYYQRIGASANEALSDFRDSGGEMQTQRWYRLYGQVGDSLARNDEAYAIAPDTLPTAEQYGEWEAGNGGQYATQVSVTFRDIDSGVFGVAQYTHITDEPHTPEEAMQAGIDLYANEDAAGRYEQEIMGAFATNVWQTVPFNS